MTGISFYPFGPLLLLGVWLGVVLSARLLRSLTFAMFVGVVLGLLSVLWLGIVGSLPEFAQLPFAVLQTLTWVHYAALARPGRRPNWFRFVVSVPALWFAASTVVAVPWAIASFMAGWWQAEPGPIVAWWLPFAVGLVGVVQSFSSRKETVHLQMSAGKARATSQGVGAVRPEPWRWTRGLSGPSDDPGPVRIGVLSDPHVGPFVSAQRLRRACARLVAANPDLVLIAGDLLTMESQGETQWLNEGLQPLGALRGRVMVCVGNHDLEDLATVRSVFEEIGARLLIDEEATVALPSGRDYRSVQVVGLDHRWPSRGSFAAELEQGRTCHRSVLASFPSIQEETLRIVLLHDPTNFSSLTSGQAPLVISGHTHGGQLGLVSIGLRWTLLRWMAPMVPDHGLWLKGKNRLYVHRGLGHYGFPLRIGVPAEESVIEVRR